MADKVEENTSIKEEPDVPVKRVPRGRRAKIDHSDKDHVCSPNHVRVPPHCRLKRGKTKQIKKISKLDQTTCAGL